MKRILTMAGIFCAAMMGINAQAQDTAFVTTVFLTPSITINGCTPADSALVSYGFINHGPYTIQPTDTFAFIDFASASEDPADGVWTFATDAPVPPGDTFAVDFNTFYTGIGTDLPINWLIDENNEIVNAPFPNGNYAGAVQWLGFVSSGGGTLDFRDDLISNNQDSTSAYADSAIGFIGIKLNCTTTGIKDAFKNKTTLNVFPNPASTELSFTNDFAAATTATVTITDIAGRVVKSMDLGKQNAGTKTFRVDIADLNKGMYYISLITDNSKSINKFIKN